MQNVFFFSIELQLHLQHFYNNFTLPLQLQLILQIHIFIYLQNVNDAKINWEKLNVFGAAINQCLQTPSAEFLRVQPWLFRAWILPSRSDVAE